ncbi:MAG: methyltransferase domain-containing protein [Rubrivivax sp.]|nr:MAG: methyltransferase domain-containing protein [Rubrivivax sp.]
MAKNLEYDTETSPLVRQHIADFIVKVHTDMPQKTGKLLEIGPQERSLVKETFSQFEYHSLDVVDTYSPSFVGDITQVNSAIPDQSFDCVVCMEVLEHCIQPFDAIKELRRILKDGGLLLLSSPLNWRIHGPVPDCWRFTEHGYKVLLKDFSNVEIDILETPGRDLFPLHYNVLATNNLKNNVDPKTLKFRFI